MDDKKKVEAVLFAVGTEISTERLASLCDLDEKKVLALMELLAKEYDGRDHSLRITRRDGNWKLTVRDEFMPLVSKLVTETDLDKALVETLAVIAWKYPVTQSEVIKLRHSKAYEHIKKLMELSFVEKFRSGRTYKLKLTKRFFEYFDLPSEEAKAAFLKKVPGDVLKKAETIEQEAKEVGLLVQQEKKETQIREEIKKALNVVKKP